MDNAHYSEDLNLSLEPHLVDILRPLQTLVSQELADKLSPYTDSLPPPTIPYSVLKSVSQWTRSIGFDTLQKQSPPLDPHAYSMVSLLAGATTSPERKFGQYIPPMEPEEAEAIKAAEKKSITALLNGLLSVFGCGFAVWWAADRLRWRNEYKVLLALFASIVVAVAEAVLYLILQSRRSRFTSKRAKPRRRTNHALLKREDSDETPDIKPGDELVTTNTSVKEVADGLRRRQ